MHNPLTAACAELLDAIEAADESAEQSADSAVIGALADALGTPFVSIVESAEGAGVVDMLVQVRIECRPVPRAPRTLH